MNQKMGGGGARKNVCSFTSNQKSEKNLNRIKLFKLSDGPNNLLS